MDIGAALTVVADGPVGPIGRQLDEQFGVPKDHHVSDWAVGMKFVVELDPETPISIPAKSCTRSASRTRDFGLHLRPPWWRTSVGIFVPSWFDCPARTTYRYLQHWMLNIPTSGSYLEGGTLRSWGAKIPQRVWQARRALPGWRRLCPNWRRQRLTNVLTGSGVDEAWATGAQLAEAVLELAKARNRLRKKTSKPVMCGAAGPVGWRKKRR